MLGLREEIGSDEIGAGGVVRHHRDFARPGELIDRHRADDLALGLDDPGIAGAENLLHARDAVRAVGERGDGLGSADLIDLRRASGAERVGQHFVYRGRRGYDDLAHPGQLGQRHGHDRGGDERCGAAGNVDADPLDGIVLLAHGGAFAVLAGPVARLAQFGEALHVADGVLDRGHDLL